MAGTTLLDDRGLPVQDADMETGAVHYHAEMREVEYGPRVDPWTVLAGVLVFAAVYVATWWALS
jgi:hypothetical protein